MKPLYKTLGIGVLVLELLTGCAKTNLPSTQGKYLNTLGSKIKVISRSERFGKYDKVTVNRASHFIEYLFDSNNNNKIIKLKVTADIVGIPHTYSKFNTRDEKFREFVFAKAKGELNQVLAEVKEHERTYALEHERQWDPYTKH